MYFEQSCIFAEFPLDPCDRIRGNESDLDRLFCSPEARFITFNNGKPLMDEKSGQIPLYKIKADCRDEAVFLGRDNGHCYFAIENSEIDAESVGGLFLDLRTIARAASADGFSAVPSLLARGKMLLDWHVRHKFCASCGEKSISRKGGYVRYCSACDTEHFPRVDPVVIMIITSADKCLMGRSPHFQPGMFSALAGFMEPGETIEEAVRREVLEEAGIEVGDVNYIKSQPWPFPSSLMIGTIGEALTDAIDIEGDELEEARWFSRDQIVTVLKSGGDDSFRVPEKLAIARHLLDHWLNHG